MFRNIPKEKLISGAKPVSVSFDLRAFRKLDIEEQLKIISDLKENVNVEI
jgi:hypothetical protein